MTPLERAQDRVRLLERALTLTPDRQEALPDPATFARRLEQRREILEVLEPPPFEPECRELRLKAARLAAEILERDAAVARRLTTMRDRIGRLLHRLAPGARAATIRKTA
jgi:hypothetical protein